MATVTIPLRIGPADHGRTMTLQEFLDAWFSAGTQERIRRIVASLESKG